MDPYLFKNLQYIWKQLKQQIKGLFGLEVFWVIWLETHNWVWELRGTHTILSVWLDFLSLFSSLKLNLVWVRVMKTRNTKLVFSISELHNSAARMQNAWPRGAHNLCIVMSAQTCFDITVANSRAKTISLSQFPQNISAKISPPFSLPSHISLLHQIEAWSGFEVISLHLDLNWSGFEIISLSVAKTFEHSSVIFSQVRISLSPSPLSMTIVWFGYCGIISVLFIFAHGYWWVCWSGFFSMDSSSIFLSFYNFCFTNLHLGLSFHYLYFIEVGLSFFLVVWNLCDTFV